MHHDPALRDLEHAHRFGTEVETAGERRTRWVVALTVTMMVAEITAGALFGSMALLADGWHMGTHAAALGVAAFAYWYARRHASDPRYTFGTGKVGALAGFGSAVGLAVVALVVIGESAVRLASPAPVQYDQALAVAVLGLLVNLASALLLRGGHGHNHGHDHHGPSDHAHAHEHGPHHHGAGAARHDDHNLRGAYLHVLADALTSVLAIAALAAGRTLGWTWMDPATGIAGGLVIARWSWGLLRDTSAVLLDGEISLERRSRIRALLEADGETRVADLHLWRVGPAHLAAIASVVTAAPRSPAFYRALLAREADLAHVTVEVHARSSTAAPADEVEREA